VLRGDDVNELEELKRQGLSIRTISRLTGLDRKTIQKYLITPELPVYGPRAAQPSKLDGFKGYLEQRMQAGVWNGRVLLRELQGMRQSNPTVDRGARNRVGGYRFRAAQAAGVRSASRWMEMSAKPGSTPAR
jgi:transposase